MNTFQKCLKPLSMEELWKLMAEFSKASSAGDKYKHSWVVEEMRNRLLGK